MTSWMPVLWLLAMLSEVSCLSQRVVTEQVQHSQTNGQGSVLAGKGLFTGATPFKNKGPACGACHSSASIGFPNGGSLGPDLTGVSAKLGPVGLEAALQTLYFPAMTPIFKARPLTPEERQDLIDFFAEGQSSTPPRDNTGVLFGIAVVGCAGLLGHIWAAGRRQPEPVRQSLVERNTEIQEKNP